MVTKYVSVAGAVIAAAVTMSTPSGAQPDALGPHAVDTFDAGSVPAAGQSIPTVVYYPADAGEPVAPVAIVHGYGENGSFHEHKATLLASHGLVAVVPSFPSKLQNPGPADGEAINALLDWASSQTDGPLAGVVDGTQRGVIGHSYGGQAVFHAAAQSSDIRAIVGLDAVGNPSLAVSASFSGPSLHLLSAQGNCNGGSLQGYNAAPSPKLAATVASSSHCDINNPADVFCPMFCGGSGWNQSYSDTYHRYAVAWVVCLLGKGDPMQSYVAGAGIDADVAAGVLTGLTSDGDIQCQPGSPDPEGGGSSSSSSSSSSGSSSSSSGGGGDGGAAASPGTEGGGAHAATPGDTDAASAGFCQFGGPPRSSAPWLLALAAFGGLLRLRRRRD